MNALDNIVEARISEAAERGDFDDLPGAGQPLALEPDEPFVAPELRMAYRILKNAGFVPEEVRLRREIHQAEQLLFEAQCADQRSQAAQQLRLLLHRLGSQRGLSLQVEQAYYQRLVQRLDEADGSAD